MQPHECYHKDGLDLLIIDVDEELDFIYYISIMVRDEGKSYQCPFAPIHKDNLQNFVDQARFYSYAEPSSISGSLDRWINFGKRGEKTFFTCSPFQIWEWMLSAIKNSGLALEDFHYDGNMHLLPIAFPVEVGDMPSEN